MMNVDALMEGGGVYNIKHRAYHFSRAVVLFVKDQKYLAVFSSLFDQLIRSATSIGANLAEGIAGSSKNDFIKFYTISLKSANETKYWLCLIRDTVVEDKQEEINKLINEADELSKIIASIIIKTKDNKIKD